jgi:hypothetical protein
MREGSKIFVFLPIFENEKSRNFPFHHVKTRHVVELRGVQNNFWILELLERLAQKKDPHENFQRAHTQEDDEYEGYVQ